MNTNAAFFAAVTILLWGLIPIFDKLALGNQSVSPVLGIAIRAGGVALVAVPLAFALDRSAGTWKALPASTVFFFLASGIASLLVSQYTYYKLLQQGDVSRIFPLLFSAAPVVSVLVSVLVLHESLNLKQAIGIIFVILGGVLLL